MRTLLTSGVHTLVQNEVYALPARMCYLYSSIALQVSNDEAFVVSTAIAINTTTPVAAAFVRCATGAAIVKLAFT